MERELGHTGYALQMLAVARPSRILLACAGDQRAAYLLPVTSAIGLLQDIMMRGTTGPVWRFAVLGGIAAVTLFLAWRGLRRGMSGA